MFLALPEKSVESGPAEIAVIVQETVLEPPADKLPTLTVGTLIEKWPLCERKLAETLDKALYAALFTLTVFFRTAVTVADCPTVKVEGI